jgi:nucleotide-binding universal stress UspA family protein
MTIVLVALLLLALVALALRHFGRFRASTRMPGTEAGRILFPFAAQGLSARALDAALRLAAAEDATLVPIFIALVPARLPLDATLTRQCAMAIPLQEAIELRAADFRVPVDARIQRGRTYRHALRQTIEQERFDRTVITARANGTAGFDADDVAWLLNNAAGEIVVLRPSLEQALGPPPTPNSEQGPMDLDGRLRRSDNRELKLSAS